MGTKRPRQECILVWHNAENENCSIWSDDETGRRSKHPCLADVGIFGHDVVEFEKVTADCQRLYGFIDVL